MRKIMLIGLLIGTVCGALYVDATDGCDHEGKGQDRDYLSCSAADCCTSVGSNSGYIDPQRFKEEECNGYAYGKNCTMTNEPYTFYYHRYIGSDCSELDSITPFNKDVPKAKVSDCYRSGD